MEDDQKNSKWKTTKKFKMEGEEITMEGNQKKIKMEDNQKNQN